MGWTLGADAFFFAVSFFGLRIRRRLWVADLEINREARAGPLGDAGWRLNRGGAALRRMLVEAGKYPGGGIHL